MNNKEKFKEVFGHYPDEDCCPYGNISCGNCPQYKYSNTYKQNHHIDDYYEASECCHKFWEAEYKAPTSKFIISEAAMGSYF